MAGEARSGLKLVTFYLYGIEQRRLNGLGSPLGIPL